MVVRDRGIEISIKGLDEVIGPRLEQPTLMVVGGHPGAGKTHFAATICVANAKRGEKCLYLSFQETLRKLASTLGNLGIELEKLVSESKVRFQKLPISLDPENIISTINSMIEEFAPGIVVVDPINVLLESAGHSLRQRSLLQNYFHELPDIIDGLVLLLAELPYGREELEIGDIEFVADAILFLKYKVKDSLIQREIEIRKFRGVPVRAAQLPFVLTSKGVRVYPPIPLREIRTRNGIVIHTISDRLEEGYGGFKLGEVASFFYPPCCPTLRAILLILEALKRYNLKGLLISYWYNENEMKSLMKTLLEQDLAFNSEFSMRIMEKMIPNYLGVLAINPLATAPAELIVSEIDEIEEKNPDVVIYLHPEMLEYFYNVEEYFKLVINKTLYLKRSGKLTINLVNKINDSVYNAYNSISDVVFDVQYSFKPAAESHVCIARRGREARCYKYSDVVNEEVFSRIASSMKEVVK